MKHENNQCAFIDWNGRTKYRDAKRTRDEEIDYISWSYSELELEWYGHQFRGLQIGGKALASAEKALRRLGKKCPIFEDLLPLDSRAFRLEATRILIKISLIRLIPFWSNLWPTDPEFRWVCGYPKITGFASLLSKKERQCWEAATPQHGFVQLFTGS